MPTGGSGGGSSGAVRAGRAFIELFANDNAVYRALDRLKARIQGVGSFVGKLGAGVGAAGAAILAPLAGMAQVFADAGSELDDMSQRTGIAVERLHDLEFAAAMSGSSLQDVEAGIRAMQKALAKGGEEADQAKGAWNELGVSLEHLRSLSPEQQFVEIAEALSKIEDPSKRAALAMQVWGKSGAQLLPLIADGKKGLDDLFAQNRQVRGVFTAADAKAAAELGDAIDILKMQFKQLVVNIGGAVAGPITEFFTLAQPIAKAVIDWVGANRQLVMIIAAVGVGLVAAGGAVAGLGVAISLIGTVVGGVVVVFKALAAAVAFLASPVGIVIAAIAALGYLFATQTEVGKAFASEVGAAFVGLKGSFLAALADMAGIVQTTFEGVSEALRAGDLQLAGEIAMQGLRTLWARTVLFLTEAWVKFKGVFVDSWHDMKAGAELLWEQATSAIAQGIISISEFMIVTFLSAIERLVGAGADLAEAVGLDDLASGIRSVGNAVGSLRENQQKFSSEMRKSIDDDLKASEKAIGQELAARKDANSKFRDTQIEAARVNVDREKEALDSLVGQAKANNAPPPVDPQAAQMASIIAQLEAASELSAGMTFRMKEVAEQAEQAFTMSRGTFNASSAAQQLAFGNRSKEADAKALLKGVIEMVKSAALQTDLTGELIDVCRDFSAFNG